MVRRYFQIKEQLSAVTELEKLLPNAVEVNALSCGFKCLANFNACDVAGREDELCGDKEHFQRDGC